MTKKIIALLVLVLCLGFVSNKALALTISPVRVEISGNPGQIVNGQMTLINEQKVAETYYSSYLNFESQGESGTPNFVPAKDDLGIWMSTLSSVTVPPAAQKIVDFSITIPANAEPGGHFAAIFWGVTPPNSGDQVGVGAKTGMLVLLTVNGNISENGGITEFGVNNHQNFFTALPVSFYTRFTNNGSDRIKPAGDIVLKDMIGLTAAKVDGNPVQGNILPKSTRRFDSVWKGEDGATPPDQKSQGNFFDKVSYEWRNFAFGYYSANISLAYGSKNEISTAHTSFWVFPWHLTLFVIISLILLFIIFRFVAKKYNHWVIMQAENMLKMEEHKKEQEKNVKEETLNKN